MVHLPYDCLRDIVTFLAEDPVLDATVLMRVSREWFVISGPVLYANPARRILLKYMQFEDTLHSFGRLLHTLLPCTPFNPWLQSQLEQCRCEYYDAPRPEGPPTTNYLQWVIHLDKDWLFLQHELIGTYSSFVLAHLLRHHPSSVQALTLEASVLNDVYPLVSRLTNVRSLELTCINDGEDAASALWLASALYAEHGSLQKFKMDAECLAEPLAGKPLDLAFLHSISELELGAWNGTVRLTSLPTARLRHLYIPFLPRYSIRQLEALFDACPLLESLGVHLQATQGFKWANLDSQFKDPASHRPKRLDRLQSLHLRGCLLTLPPALEDSLGIWGNQLESLTVELTGGLDEDYHGRLQWSVPMYRLRRLCLKDKALFALTGSSMQHCQNVTHLTLYIQAEYSAFGCILPQPGLPKWVWLNSVFKGMAEFVTNLKYLRIQGYWIITSSVFQHLTQLQSLEQLVVGKSLVRAPIASMAKWVASMPRLRYALLPNMTRHFGPNQQDIATWIKDFERTGLVLEIQEGGVDWEA